MILQTLTTYIQRFIVMFGAITIHEFAHGLVAYKLGDPTAKNSGRLTLNPLSHIDPIGALCMVLFGFGWAKPVPINPYYFRNRKSGTVLVSLAGPAANIIMAFLSTVIVVPAFLIEFRFWNVTLLRSALNFVTGTLVQFALLNIGLAVFNLIPFPPLDGSKVLGALLPANAYMTLLKYERFGFPILIILSLTGILGRILGVIINPLYNLWLNIVNVLLDILRPLVI